MKRKLLFAVLCTIAWVNTYAVDWTDKTSLITNPSFETDAAVSDATKNALNSASVTGWTVLPTTTVSNAQAAVVNSSSTLSVLNGSDGATTGSKYFYVRQNWNNTGNFGIEQTIPAENLPAGLYLLTCKIKTSSSSPASSSWTLSIKEGDNTAVTNTNAGSAAEWLNYGVVLYKASSSTTLTISAYMVAGASGGSQHYAMLLDDFQLKYVSPTDMGTITASSTLDLSGVIYNEGIYNANKTVMPRGWIAYADTRGNSNYTEGTGDTQLEGWSGSNMNIDYYQLLSNLPKGKYTVTAYAHDSNDTGAVVYGWSGDEEKTGDMGSSYADVTTDAFKVTDGTIHMGIKHNGGASWVTGDNFRVTYLGIKPMYDDAYTAATTARDNDTYANVSGKEKADLLEAIALTPSTYEDYQAAITALNNATSAFTAAKDTWDACVAEYTHYTELSGSADYSTFYSSTTTGADVLNAIKTAEYTAVTTKYDTDGSALFISSWDVTNFDALDNQHWSGATSTYYDKWSGSAFNCSISKTVTLPEGHYVLYAAGRGQANSASAVTLKVAISGGSTLTQSYTMKGDTGKGIDTSGATNFGEGTFANNNAGRGWEWRYIAFDLDAETSVTLSIEGAGNNSWVSACDTKLLTYENVEVSRRLYVANKETAETARDNSTYENVNGAERATLLSAIGATPETTYSGYLSAANALETATNAFIAAKTNWDALVREISKATALGASTTAAETARDAAATTSAGALAATQALKVVEYNYVTDTYEYGVDLGTWTTTGSTGSLSSQHWSGETHEYLEQSASNWAAGSWTIKYAQDITLPAGNYVFKVAGRQANSDGVTLSLTVKNGETELGTVSDFPRGDSGLGITTAGATSFDPNDTFCNTRNNNGDNLKTNGGNGWEWRYVKFTLAEDATVKVPVDAVATAQYMWVSFCDATVQTDDEANVSLIAYNIALASAETVLADDTYENVGGTDKSNLQAAIAADESLDKSDAEKIDAATATLTSATTAFTSGVESWNAYVLAKGYADEITAVALPYATSAKISAVATAKNATVNTAADAATQTAAINTANRTAYESNAIAENVPGVARTNLIQNPDGSNTAGWSGSFWTQTGEPYTEANGNSTNTYFDKNNVKSFTTSQTITLAAGTYILSVTARAQNGIDSYKMQVTNNADETEEVALTAMGNANGVFGRGWNDFYVVFEQKELGDATISIIGDNTTSNANLWMSWDRLRLYSIGSEGAYELDEDVAYSPVALEGVDVTLTRNIAADTWSTFVVPFDIDNATMEDQFGADVQVSEFSADDKTGLTFTPMAEPAITANTPVLVKTSSNKSSFTFSGVTIKAATPTISDNGVNFVGNYDGDIAIPNTLDTYFVKSNTIKKSTGAQKLKGFRAYFTVDADSPVKAFFENDIFIDDEATGLVNLNDNLNKNEAIYNLAGQRVSKAVKGLYIKNGKKVIIK